MNESEIDKEQLIEEHIEHLLCKASYQEQVSMGKEFGTEEHILLGVCGPSNIFIRPNFPLSYGEIMGLAGDYYGTPEEMCQDSEEDIKVILDLYGYNTVLEVAKRLHKTPQTIRNWLKDNRMQGIKLNKGSAQDRYLIPRYAVEKMICEAQA